MKCLSYKIDVFFFTLLGYRFIDEATNKLVWEGNFVSLFICVCMRDVSVCLCM